MPIKEKIGKKCKVFSFLVLLKSTFCKDKPERLQTSGRVVFGLLQGGSF
jgi:hypothetical protein